MKADIPSCIKIITPSGELSEYSFESSVMALGTFDGVHIAHRKLLSEACKLRKRICAEAVGVWCFDESPAIILRSDTPAMLATPEERLSMLLDAGADFVAVAKFEDFRGMEASDFVNDFLISLFSAVGTVCGYDHRFGKNGVGSPAMLEEIFGNENTVNVAEMKLDGETVSSSAVREHLRLGEIDTANKMLGRAFSFTAPVGEGKKLGRKLGFPTANQVFPEGLIRIKHGVYATRCFVDGESCLGISNVGVRPSISDGDDHSINCETYILGLSKELYGKQMTVEFCSYLREEKKFSSLEELKQAIANDRISCENYFSQKSK